MSCLSLNSYSNLLASGQTGSQSVVRVWRYQTGECVAMFKGHVHSLSNLSLSHSGGVLCGVGKDSHGKNVSDGTSKALACIYKCFKSRPPFYWRKCIFIVVHDKCILTMCTTFSH